MERTSQARFASREPIRHIRKRTIASMRRKITGAETKRVRDHVRERLAERVVHVRHRMSRVRNRMEEPPSVRLKDKVSFMLGVLGCFVTEFALLRQPMHFGRWYVGFIIPLLLLRLWMYAAFKWHYFLLDFCYVVNVACVAMVVVYPHNRILLLVNFAHASGPLALAVPTWRNSLVFHSLDKITSVFIHALPATLLFCIRWYPPPGRELPPALSYADMMTYGVGGYLLWQIFYLAITEVLLAHRLNSNQELMTSIRWLTTPPLSGLAKLTQTVCRRVGIFKPAETFDSESWKTKTIFMTVQLLYTTVALQLVPLLYASFNLHSAYLLTILCFCVWNGSNYYIEVFSKAYRKQFEGDAAARHAARMEAMEAPQRQSSGAASVESNESKDE